MFYPIYSKTYDIALNNDTIKYPFFLVDFFIFTL